MIVYNGLYCAECPFHHTHRKYLNILKRKGVDGFLVGIKYWCTKPKAKKESE